MAWYKTGSVSVTNGQTSITGTGTKFATNARVGDGFNGPDGNWYEVTNITSETVLAIFPPYQGATVSTSTNYMIAPLQGYNKESADRLRAITDGFLGGRLESIKALTTVPNDILVAAEGTTMIALNTGTAGRSILGQETVPSTKLFLSLDQVNNTSDANKPISTATAASLSATNTNVSTLQGQVSTLQSQVVGINGRDSGFVTGLFPSYVTGTTLNIFPGTAYIPGTGKFLTSGLITLSNLSLASSSWYHAYIYESGSTVAIEFSTAAPSGVYTGTARTKNGDTSRRYLFSLLTNTSGQIFPFNKTSDNFINYRTVTTSAPFRIVSGATSTSVATVNANSAVPVTTTSLKLHINNSSTGTCYLSYPGTSDQILAATATTRINVTYYTNDSQQIAYIANSGGTGLSVDITGYGMDR